MALPNGYTQLEYIYASGKQYINTGYTAKSTTTAKYKVCLNEVKQVGPHILSGNSFFFPLFRSYTGSPFFTKRGGKDWLNTTSFFAGYVYEVDAFTNDKIIVNGTEYGTLACGSTKTDTSPLYLLTYPGALGDARYTMKGYLYYCQIYENGVLVRDLVPAMRDADLEVGLYDLVNDVFYTNEGTGVFASNKPTVDTRVPTEYTKLSYIQSDGQQYINTKYFPTANTRVAASMMQLEVPESGKSNTFYGSYSTNNLFCCFISADPRVTIYYGNKTVTGLGAPVPGYDVDIDHVGSSAIIRYPRLDQTYQLAVDSATFSGNSVVPIYVFAFNVNNESLGSGRGYAKLYNFKIYDNGVLVRWFVPVRRKSDGEIGLYDAVAKEFYANQGTGTFIAGEDLPDDEWETDGVSFGMAVINGVALPIAGGMAKLGGVVRPITGGMVKTGGAVKRIGV